MLDVGAVSRHLLRGAPFVWQVPPLSPLQMVP